MRLKAIARDGLICFLFALLTAVLAQIEIPLPYVPISGQTLAVGLTATIAGSRLGALSMIVYTILGATGVPVFTGFDAGLDVITGPTGGYIFGFTAAAFVIGRILEKKGFTVKKALLANVIGMIVILLSGMVWLKYAANLSWSAALASGVYPFLITGLIKAFLAAWIGIKVRDKLKEKGIEIIYPS